MSEHSHKWKNHEHENGGIIYSEDGLAAQFCIECGLNRFETKHFQPLVEIEK